MTTRAPESGDAEPEEGTRVSGPDAEGQYDPPAGATVHECEYCGQPLADERLLALHRGQAHEEALSEAHREAYRAAYDAETEAVREFQLKAAGVVVLLYFGFLMVYALV